MASKKKIVRCNCCGVKAAGYIGEKRIEELAVCKNIVCEVATKETIVATINGVKQAIEENKVVKE